MGGRVDVGKTDYWRPDVIILVFGVEEKMKMMAEGLMPVQLLV
jgi:hypothetical protein